MKHTFHFARTDSACNAAPLRNSLIAGLMELLMQLPKSIRKNASSLGNRLRRELRLGSVRARVSIDCPCVPVAFHQATFLRHCLFGVFKVMSILTCRRVFGKGENAKHYDLTREIVTFEKK
jgi:hypothetical protein